jgi:hypothetical protein
MTKERRFVVFVTLAAHRLARTMHQRYQGTGATGCLIGNVARAPQVVVLQGS